jgi:hypothetical protein
MISRAGPTTRKFLYGDHVRFFDTGKLEYRIHEGHSGWIAKTTVYKGGPRRHLRYRTECECGSTLLPIAPSMELVTRPLNVLDVTETVRAARVRFLLDIAGIPEQDTISLEFLMDVLVERTLSAREIEIVLDRHGLTDDRHTLQQIADRLGVTRSRVQQLEHKAIERLRRGTL